jgi:hypothetical protein
MGGGGYAPSLDNLQALCAALEAANTFLETAIPDADERGKALREAEEDLREALDGVQAEADELQKEVEASESQAIASAGELGTAAQEALDTSLAGLDEKVAQSADETHQELTQRATALEAQVEELQGRGFDALESVLAQEQAEFEQWTTDADTAMQALVVDFEEALQEVQSVDTQTVSALNDADQVIRQAWQEAQHTLQEEMDRFDKEEPEELERRGDEVATAAATFIQEWRSGLDADASAAQDTAEGHGTAGGQGLEEETRELTAAVGAAASELEQTEAEFERAAAGAETDQPRVVSVADLRSEIAKAEEELREIREAMETLNE